MKREGEREREREKQRQNGQRPAASSFFIGVVFVDWFSLFGCV